VNIAHLLISFALSSLIYFSVAMSLSNFADEVTPEESPKEVKEIIDPFLKWTQDMNRVNNNLREQSDE